MTVWQWFLIITSIAPIPIALGWRWYVIRRNARMVRDMMEERRAKFGGAIRIPGSKEVQKIERKTR